MAGHSQNDWCITNRKRFATILKRLQKVEGVLSLLVANSQGEVWYTTMDNELTALRYITLWKPFCMRTMSLFRDLDTTDEVISIVITTKKHDLLIIPDEEFLLMALQKIGPGKKLNPEIADGVVDAQVET